jgi:cobalt-zinc-cadmium efflux system membrane fusion protein
VRRKPLLAYGLLLVAWSVVLVGCTKKASTEKAAEERDDGKTVHLSPEALKVSGVEVQPVQSEVVADIVQLTGLVTPDQDSIVHIRPLARGRVERVSVGLGDAVRVGQPLLEYDNIELGEVLGEYQAEWAGLQRDQAQAEDSRKALDRAALMLEKEAIAQKDYDLRVAEHESAKAAVEGRWANLRRLEEKLVRFGLRKSDVQELQKNGSRPPSLAHTVLRSPLEGIVLKRDAAQGEVIDPSQELFTIVNMNFMWVQGDLPERDLGKVRLGNKVQVRVAAYPDESFEGRLTYISDMLDPETRVVKVRCVVPNPHRELKLEMFATVMIEAVSQRRALMVPHSALLGDRDTYYVFVERVPGQFEKRVVKIADQHKDFTEVLTGLKEAERVASKGAFYLKSEAQRELIGEEE